MLLMIDNYDSFTYNLVQYFEEIRIGFTGLQVNRFAGKEFETPTHIPVNPLTRKPVNLIAVKVVRNNEITLEKIKELNPNYIVISPGPCSPNEAGISLNVIERFAGKIPILGVCLGHQCMGQIFGGNIIRAKKVMHGKVSAIYHQQQGIFKNLKNPFIATRYHSLVIEKESLPECFDITAWTENPDGSMDEIMGIQHKTLALHGVQFHPESILTEHGHELLANFILS